MLTLWTNGMTGVFVLVLGLFYTIAISFDLYQGSMMDYAINGSRGKGIVVIQNFSRISEARLVVTMVEPHSYRLECRNQERISQKWKCVQSDIQTTQNRSAECQNRLYCWGVQ